MTFVSEIEAVSTANPFRRGGVVDEKRGIVDVVFLAEFTGEDLHKRVPSGGLELRME